GYVDGKLLGIVHYIYHRSCWTIGDYCYLQDLFVAEGARKLGLGRALIEAVYEAARAAGASRVHWLTHETNAVARRLYDTPADRPRLIQDRQLFRGFAVQLRSVRNGAGNGWSASSVVSPMAAFSRR